MLNSILFYGVLFAVIGVPFYFNYKIKNQKQPLELSAVNNFSAILTVFILLSLFFLSVLNDSSNDGQMKISFGACLFSFFLLFSFQSKINQEIREIKVTHSDRFKSSAREFAAVALAFGIFLSTSMITTHFFNSLLGLIAGILCTLMSMPLVIRVWLPSRPMQDSELKAEIMNVFSQAKTPIHEVYLIDTDKFKSYNALVTGQKYAFGPLKRCVFITQNLFSSLEKEEILAVIYHEASHFKLNHFPKRILASVLGTAIANFVVIIPFALLILRLEQMGFGKDRSVQALSFMLMLVCFVSFQSFFICKAMHKHEHEADLEAIKLGASSSALVSALVKLTDKNGASKNKKNWATRFIYGNSHPSVEDRITTINSLTMPTRPPFTSWKIATVYSFGVLFLGIFAVQDVKARIKNSLDRKVASVTQDLTRQILPATKNQVQLSPSNTEE